MPPYFTTRVARAIGLFVAGALVFSALFASPPLVLAAEACPCFTADEILDLCPDGPKPWGQPLLHQDEAFPVKTLSCPDYHDPFAFRAYVLDYKAESDRPLSFASCTVLVDRNVAIREGIPNDYDFLKIKGEFTLGELTDCARQLDEAAKELGIQ